MGKGESGSEKISNRCWFVKRILAAANCLNAYGPGGAASTRIRAYFVEIPWPSGGVVVHGSH